MSNTEGRPMLTPELIAALARSVPPRAALVWVYLWNRADRQTGKAWPSGRTIAKDLGMRRNHLHEDIRRLESAGWLLVERGHGALNRYVVTVPQVVDAKTGLPPNKVDAKTGLPVGAVSGLPVGAETGLASEPYHRTPPLNPTKARRTKGTKEDALEELTLPFDSPEFRKAWLDFREHRKQIKAPLTVLGATRLLSKCQRFGEPTALESIDLSIENGWKGLFPPKSNGNGKSDGEPYRPVRIHQ